MRKTVEELLQTPYWIVDILPAQVPADSAGQYFAVEKYLRQKERLAELKHKHINFVLKLNCYRDLSIDEEAEINPPPERVAEEMRKRIVYLMTDGAMILSEPDDTHLTVFNADPPLTRLIKELAAGEGLYVWQPRWAE